MVGEQWTGDHTTLFITGYVVELSLSMDNVFVIALIFTFFRVPSCYQHRVLFWGILGAILMRGLMIGIGAAAVMAWHWILYLFGAFLLFTGIKMLFADDDEGVEPSHSRHPAIGRKAGASTGTNLWGALQIAGRMIDKGETGSIVTLMCDSGQRYLDTYYDPAWIASQGLDLASHLAQLERAMSGEAA